MVRKASRKRIEEAKKRILMLLEKILPYKYYRYILFLYQKMKTKGVPRSYEEAYFFKWHPFSKKNYYIIRMEYPDFAHFAAARRCIFACEYIRHKGMYPVIDLEWKPDLKKGILNGENRWEDVFQQKKIEDIVGENATIFVGAINDVGTLVLPETCANINCDPTDSCLHATEVDWINYYKTIHTYVKKYWHFNQFIEREVDKQAEKIFKDKEKILGVALREDFSEEFYDLLTSEDAKEIFRSHPIGLGLDEIVDVVATSAQKWGCDKIFVASMYDDSIRKFEDAFPGRIVCCDRERLNMRESIDQINSRKKYMDDAFGKDQKHRESLCKRGKKYAQETILLSKCSYLIGMKSGQTIAALALNGGRYSEIKILEDKNHIGRY